jgi:Phage tail sheath protein subtilisin-like domain/Phage tail sheath C-terminal domain
MSSRTIASPGVQINEIDLSTISRPIGSTDILITGFADQGPTYQFVNVSSVSEYEQIFGIPKNGAERYLYHTARQVLLNSPANLTVARLPYGTNLGEGYTNSYSILAYPISVNSTSTALIGLTSISISDGGTGYDIAPNVEILGGGLSGLDPIDKATAHAIIYDSSYLTSQSLSAYVGQVSAVVIDHAGSGYVTDPLIVLTGGAYSSQAQAMADIGVAGYIGGTYESSTTYTLGKPTSLLISDDQYQQLTSNAVNWSTTPSGSIQTFDDIGNAGLVIINNSKTSVNNLYEGYYVAIADNSTFNPSTDYTCINSISAVVGSNDNTQIFAKVPETRLSFTLTQTFSSNGANSISKLIEHYPTGYDFGTKAFADSLVILLVKLKTTQYNQDTVTLDYSIAEGYSGSLYANRTQNNPLGGTPSSFFIDTVVNNSSKNIKVITNPNISQTGTWIKDDAKYGSLPAKSVLVDDSAKALISTGVYVSDTNAKIKDLGEVPLKLEKLLNQLEDNDSINVDIIAEAGLGTIWSSAYTKSYDSNYVSLSAYNLFDETYNVSLSAGSTANGGFGLMINTGDNPDGYAYDGYKDILDQFVSFADQTRKDHIFIADPLRHIFVQGENLKTSSKSNYVFSNDIYWPLKNLFNSVQSSYVATYGNWIKTNDIFINKQVWLPSSGYAAAIYASTSQSAYPWIAPAGFNRGTINNVTDIAINPTQKQRDLLYKININPIAYFNNDGFVIYGQKTLFRKPSAFDRVNVRRLFLTLEKEAQALLKYFVFEPNSFATRNRLKGALVPIFDQAKLNDGLYDYLLVCDETNNTPDVIDNNELRISIYIKPVRAAEFILADFVATRTGVDFSELIG